MGLLIAALVPSAFFGFLPLALLRVNGQNGLNMGESGIPKATTQNPLEVGQCYSQQTKDVL
jgi:hypothetical protein